jgi:multidrug efflux pump subunit AcrA (membrane-fusion protein)
MQVQEPDPRMADGMTVRVELPLVNEPKTIKIPSAWLTEVNGQIGLFVVKGDKAFFKAVTLGAYYDQRVEIINGLEGEELVITNPSGIKAGELVRY